jgi:uncharacterized membrane protein
VWLGIVPATLALGIGAAMRRLLPQHPFVYILARRFLGTLLDCAAAGWMSQALRDAPSATTPSELARAQPLAAFGEATLTGMLTANLVVLHPQWLATQSDRLCLPERDDV